MISKKSVAVFALTEPWMQEMMLKAAPSEFEVCFIDLKDKEAAQKLLPRADFLMTTRLPEAYVPLLKNCKLVQIHGVGYDGIDTKGLARAGIPLAFTPEGTILGVAEHTLLLILALYKQLVPIHESMREGKYNSMSWRVNSHLLFGKTVGVIGFGRVGRRVSRLIRGFEIDLLYHDVFRPSAAIEQEMGATYAAFAEVLARADIISVHTPLTDKTRGLFGAGEFAQMKSGALFINTSRGETYDMNALYESLRSGHLGGAGLDVFNPEPPPPDHPILRLPNVICTPHTSAGTIEAQQMKAQVQFENFMRVLRGETPHHLLNLTDPG
jgi:phosphoglycerate dehydrogenase-like enzyme